MNQRPVCAFAARGYAHFGVAHITSEPRMTGRIALPISIAAALLGCPALLPQAAAQAVGTDEAHGPPAQLAPRVALSPAQKRAIYAAVSGQRLRTSAAEIPLIVGAIVPRSAVLLTLPDDARDDDLSTR